MRLITPPEEVEKKIGRPRMAPANSMRLRTHQILRIETDTGALTVHLLDDTSRRARVMYNLMDRQLPPVIQINGAIPRHGSFMPLWTVQGARLQIVADGRTITLPPIRHAWRNGQQIF